MELEKQIVSLELSRRLKELGVKQESLFYWAQVDKYPNGIKWDVLKKGERRTHGDYVAAFTVAELGEMLPNKLGDEHILIVWKNAAWNVTYEDSDGGKIRVEMAYDEADARAKMLIYLIENKLITL